MTDDKAERERARRRAYMRTYSGRGGTLSPKEVAGGASHEPPFSIKTAAATYLPGRDPPVRHADLTAQLMGDPPVGRRALDKAPDER